MEQTVKKKFGIRDIMTIAAMMVITYLVAMVIGSVTLPLPVVYLYGSAGIDAFNRRNLLSGRGEPRQQTWSAVRMGRSLWGDSRSHGLYVPDSIFPCGSTHCRANHDWQGYIPQCCP